ncbi:PH domain-containing protein [Sarocladium implicatum]|nr:PH domain-containing protein [Sarocladium implicatum]
MSISNAGLVAPPPSIPLPPPPPVPRASRDQQPRPQHFRPEEEGPSSRYRTLRGKSVSTPRLRAQLDVYKDLNGSPLPIQRRRSKSVTQRRIGSTPNKPPAFALTPKQINLPIVENRERSPVGKPQSPTTTPISTASARPSALKNFETANGEVTDGEGPKPVVPAKQSPSVPRESVLYAGEVARLEAETDRILAEQKKLDLARLQAQLAAAKTPPPKSKRPILGKLTFLSRGSAKKSNAGSVPGTPSTITSTLYSLDLSRETTPASTPSPEKINFLDMGISPLMLDAPASASNGGERRVTVRCMSSTINLPVTTETSPVDIIYASANFTTHQIDPASCIVVECYVVLGLERRVRRYERVRDIMNSWDRDQQNSLLITPIEPSDDVSNLDMASVPRTAEAPQGFSLHIYHSSRPGRWNKRWVTLSENGQMFACKKPDGKASDKDSAALCHLSDFDIYTPKPSELQRHLKPPERFCYAIKSQQKTAVFSNNTENFVHFFSTDDPEMAKRFRTTVHAWRSWYLVNKQVDLQKKDKPQPLSPKSASATNSDPRSPAQAANDSGEDKPYMIGEFQPLMDMDRFNKPLEEFGKEVEAEARALQEKIKAEQRELAEKQKSKMPPEQLRKLQSSQSPKSPGEFSAGGLLGDGYEKRKQANATSTPGTPAKDGPFTDGPSLLQQAASKSDTPEKPEPQSWFPSASEHSARSRSQSIANARRPATSDGSRPPMPQQPLLKLSQKDMRRPYPHPRPGNGVKPPNGGPLINYATGGPPPHPFQDGPPRGMPRHHPGPSPRMMRPPPPGQGPPGRPRRKSESHHGNGGGPRRMGPEDRPPIPPLPHRSGRRDGMPHNGAPRAAVGARGPLVDHAR